MAGLVYTSDVFGGAPAVSVATFGDLPVSGDVDQRILVTGETSLFSSSYPVVCVWEDEQWKLENARCTYVNLGAAEFGSGVWVGTGLSLNTSSKCEIIDTTYNESWVWNTSNNVFLPTRLVGKTIDNIKSIKGDSTSPTGWTQTLSNGSGTGTLGVATATTSAISVGGPTALTLGATATQNLSTGAYTAYTFTDTNISTTTKFYFKGLVSQSLVRGGGGISGSVNIRLQYENGSSSVDFGGYDSSGSGGTKDGLFFNAQNCTTYTTAAGGTNTEDVMTSETLVQLYVEGERAFVKVGNNPWKNVRVFSGLQRATAAKAFGLFAVVQPSASGTYSSTLKVAYAQAIRYT
jgi:hypothetical protein